MPRRHGRSFHAFVALLISLNGYFVALRVLCVKQARDNKLFIVHGSNSIDYLTNEFLIATKARKIISCFRGNIIFHAFGKKEGLKQ